MIAINQVDEDRLRQVVETILPVARKRAELLGEMSEALQRGDDSAALALARRICGLPTTEIAR
jgi:hypothetical protein